MSQGLSQEQVQEIREVFNLFDQDGSGSISNEEVRLVMKSLGHDADEAEIEEMIRNFDTDGNGEIDFEEFCQMFGSRILQSTNPEELIREVFEAFDENKKGFVTCDDLERVWHTLGEKDDDFNPVELFAAADINGDGTIDFEEFIKLMTAGVD